METTGNQKEHSDPPQRSLSAPTAPPVSIAFRTMVGAILICGVGVALWLNSLGSIPFVYAAAAAAVVAVGTDEFCRLARGRGVYLPRAPMVFAGVAFFGLQWAGWVLPRWPSPWLMVTAFAVVLSAGLLTGSVLRRHIEGTMERFAAGLACFVYVPVLFGFLSGVAARWATAGLITVLAVCKSTDIGAYYFGKALRGPKLAPRLSPKKTVWGAVGAFVAGTGVSLALHVASPWSIMPGPSVAALYGVGVTAVAIFGDLTESALKRQCGVKDSGHLLSGYGGMLDMIDDLLFVAPFSYFFFSYLPGT